MYGKIRFLFSRDITADNHHNSDELLYCCCDTLTAKQFLCDRHRELTPAIFCLSSAYQHIFYENGCLHVTQVLALKRHFFRCTLVVWFSLLTLLQRKRHGIFIALPQFKRYLILNMPHKFIHVRFLNLSR
jgi:hypothetical protein